MKGCESFMEESPAIIPLPLQRPSRTHTVHFRKRASHRL